MKDNKDLAKEVIEFLYGCEVLNEPLTAEEESKIERGLVEPRFVEELIGILMYYVKCGKKINYKKMKALYLKLNDLRFDLECKGMNGQ